MLIYYSGADARYGALVDRAVLRTNVMMTFTKAVGDTNHSGRFFELKKKRLEKKRGK